MRKRLDKGLRNNYSIFNSGKYFGENISENYLLFQQFSKNLTSENGKIGLWQSKIMSEENITPPKQQTKSLIQKYFIVMVKDK